MGEGGGNLSEASPSFSSFSDFGRIFCVTERLKDDQDPLGEKLGLVFFALHSGPTVSTVCRVCLVLQPCGPRSGEFPVGA